MSYSTSNNFKHYTVRCGHCSALIDTALLEVQAIVPTSGVEVAGELTQKSCSANSIPYATCPNCGSPLIVKGVKEV